MSKKKKTYLILGIISVIVIILFYIYLLHFSAMQRDTLYDGYSLIVPAWKDMWLHPAHIAINPTHLGLGTLCIIAVPVVLYNEILKAEQRRHYQRDIALGSSAWMSEEELDDFTRRFAEPFGKPGHDGMNNMIMARDFYMSLDNRGIGDHNEHLSRNMNVLCIGGSGAGKTFGLVGPNIMQANASMIITDPSGELYRNYSWFLENQGYKVKCLNLSRMDRSNHYNPFYYLSCDLDIEILVQTIMDNTDDLKSGAGSGDPFWPKAEAMFMRATIAYLYHYGKPESQNFRNIMYLLRCAVEDENAEVKNKLDEYFDRVMETDADGYAVKNWDLYKSGNAKTRQSVLMSVASRLSKFNLEDLAALTDYDDIELDRVGDEKTALFIIIPTGSSAFGFVAGMMYSQFFTRAYSYCENEARYSQVIYDENNQVIKTFRANDEEESERVAKKKAEIYLKMLQTAEVKYDWKLKAFTIRSQKGHLLGIRHQEKQAVQFIESAKKAKIQLLDLARLPVHTRLLQDEFATTGKIPDYVDKISTVRKYDLSCTIIVQSLQQLQNLYKDEWEVICANCDHTIYLGGGADKTTMEWFRDLLGKETRTIMGMSSSGPAMNSSYNSQAVDLVGIDELRRLSEKECIIMPKSLKAYKGPKTSAAKHKNWKYCNGIHKTRFNAVKADILRREYDKMEAESFDDMALELSKHGAVVETEETSVRLEEKNKAHEEHAKEAERNTDLEGAPLITKPIDVSTPGSKHEGTPIGDICNIESRTNVDEAESGIIDINSSDIFNDEFEYETVEPGWVPESKREDSTPDKKDDSVDEQKIAMSPVMIDESDEDFPYEDSSPFGDAADFF